MNEVDVAIVGGGSTGLFAAYFLTLTGAGVIEVFEANYLSYGGTGRCAGGIRASFTSDVHVTLMRESIKLWKKLSDEIEGLTFYQNGYLWLLTNDKLVNDHIKLQRLHNELGVPTRLIYPDEIKEIVPALKLNDVIAALYDPTAGWSYPFGTVFALYRFLRKEGVKITPYTPVRKIVVSKGRAVAVETPKGSVKVNKAVIIASGFWSKELLKQLGYELPIKGDPHHLLITEKVERFIQPLVIHKESGSYIVQGETGGILLGTEYPVSEQDLDIHFGYLTKVAKIMSKYFPLIRTANVLRIWTGYYLKTPDHHPIVGKVPGYENILLATGYSGHGYMMGPIIGKELANYVLKGRPELNETIKLDPTRFERGELLEEKAIFG
jgi:sarcosine oxidase subunit beta